jgi:hypothetical protein
MAQTMGRCEGGSRWRQPKSSARERELVGSRFYRGLLLALVIEAGVGAFLWLAIYVA